MKSIDAVDLLIKLVLVKRIRRFSCCKFCVHMDVNKTKLERNGALSHDVGKTKLSAIEVYLLETALRMVFIQNISEERVT